MRVKVGTAVIRGKRRGFIEDLDIEGEPGNWTISAWVYWPSTRSTADVYVPGKRETVPLDDLMFEEE